MADAPRIPADRAAGAAPFAVPVAVVLAAGALAWHEGRLREAGFRPSVTDSPALRGWVRDGAGDPGAVVLAGGSRMQLGFDPATFHERHPGRPLANLSLNGNSGAGLLEDLAADGRFAGTVLLDFSCHHMRPDVLAASRAWVADARRRGPGAKASARLHAALAGTFAFPDAGPGWRRLWDLYWQNRAATPYYVRMRPDRSRPADYADLDERGGLKRLRDRRVAKLAAKGPPERADPRAWRRAVAPLEGWVAAIEGRGGRVAFVRFPTTGPHWRRDRKTYPRRRFWDRLAALTGAETVHFADVPALSGFECPDTSHLDSRDAPAFTKGLLDELADRGVL